MLSNFKEGTKIFLGVVALIVVVGVLWVVGAFVVGGASQITAPFRGKTSEKNKTVADGAFRVSSYEDFFTKCASIQAKESSIRNIDDELKSTTLSETRREQLDEAVLANKNQRSSLIAQYNAMTSNKFRSAYLDKGLPLDIDETDMHTLCK